MNLKSHLNNSEHNFTHPSHIHTHTHTCMHLAQSMHTHTFYVYDPDDTYTYILCVCVCIGWLVGKRIARGYYSRHPETLQYNKDTITKMREKRYKGRINSAFSKRNK